MAIFILHADNPILCVNPGGGMEIYNENLPWGCGGISLSLIPWETESWERARDEATFISCDCWVSMYIFSHVCTTKQAASHLCKKKKKNLLSCHCLRVNWLISSYTLGPPWVSWAITMATDFSWVSWSIIRVLRSWLPKHHRSISPIELCFGE